MKVDLICVGSGISGYLDYLGGGCNDPEVTQSYVDHAPENRSFFRDGGECAIE